MIAIPTTGVLCLGQSNMSPTLQLALAEQVAKRSYGRAYAFGNRFGGQSMASRIAGSPGAYTRTANYNTEISMWGSNTFDKLIVVLFQGESDAETTDATNQFTGRLNAWFEFIRADMLNPGGTVKSIYCLPWRDDAANGFGIGGNGDTIRTLLINRAATEAPNSVTYETSSYARTDHVHINSGPVLANVAPDLGALIQAFF